MPTVLRVVSAAMPVDPTKLQQLFRDIVRLSAVDSRRSGVFQEKIVLLAGKMNDMDGYLRRALPLLETTLRDAAEQPQLDTVRELHEVLAQPTLSAQAQADLTQEIENLQASLTEAFAHAITLVRTERNRLEVSIAAVENIRIEERLEDAVELARKTRDEFSQQIDTLIKSRLESDASRQTLIQSMDLLRTRHLFDVLKDYIPTPEMLASMDLTSPEIDLVKQSVALAKKAFANIVEGVRYSNLAAAKMQLDEAIDQVDLDIRLTREQLRDAEEKMSGQDAVLAAMAKRILVVAELRKIADSWKEAIQVLVALEQSPTEYSALEAALLRQRDSLEAFTAAYVSAVIV